MPTITISLPSYVTELQAEPFERTPGASGQVPQTVSLTAGAGSIVVAATGADWCWRFTEHGPGYAAVRFVTVSGSTSYSSLSNVDPSTFLAILAPTTSAWEATANAAAAAVAGKVDHGDLVFSVKRYGALGNWTSGSSGTDDTAAINAALSAAAAAAASGACAARVLFPWTMGNGYKTTAAITVPAGVELDMRAPIVPTVGGFAALTVGVSTWQAKRHHRIMVRKSTFSNWSSESEVAVVLRNHYSSRFDIVQADQCTIGVVCIGDNNNGFSYNHVMIDQIAENKVCVDLTNDTGGWCNENDFYGGRFVVSSSTNTSLDRIGVRSTSRQATPYYNNANVFHKPSFELKGQAIVGTSICALMEYATAHSFSKARHESNSPGVMVQNNSSHSNEMDFTYADLGAARPYLINNSTSSSGRVRMLYEQMIDNSQRVIFKANAVHKSACYYDGNSAVNLPGLTVGTGATGNTDARAATLISMAADYVEIPNGRYAGVYMGTRGLKRFAMFRDCDAGFGGRIILRCYDSGGSIISTGAPVVTTIPASAPFYTTSYGGAWSLGTDSNAAYDFKVANTVDYVFVAIAGGTNPARLRSFTIAAMDTQDAPTWLAFPDLGRNYGTVAPTAGTWAVGREVWNAAPAAGQPSSWVCTVAGTPGTWLARS